MSIGNNESAATSTRARSRAFRVEPRIGQRNPEHLIIVLGGAPLTPDDLMATADILVARVPGAAAMILEPPQDSEGQTWFAEPEAASVQVALERAWARIEKARDADGLSSGQMSIFGFGQGATLALAAAAAGHPFACVLALSGRLVGDLKARRANSPDLFISYGERDTTNAASEALVAAEAFSRRGYDVALIPVPLLGREIDAEQLHQGAAFLRGAIIGQDQQVSGRGRA